MLWKRRPFLVVGLLLVVSVVVSACSVESVSNEAEGEEESAGIVAGDLGVVLSLSGPNAGYGESTRAGIELALEDLQDEEHGPAGVEISASFLDDQGDAETGAAAFQEHVDNEVMAIIGPTLSNTAFEAHPVAQEAGVPVVAVSNTAEGITDIGDYIYRVSLTEATVVPQTVEAVAEEFGPESAALVYSGDDAWSSSSADAFRAAAEDHGIQVLVEEDVPTGTGDVSETINAVAEADPDVIFLASLERESVQVVREVREQGLDQRVVCGNGCNAGTFIDETGEASDGTVVGSAWHIDVENEQTSGFAERYREMHGEDPDQFSAQGYAGIQVLAEAMGEAGSSEPRDVRDALAGLGEVETVLGGFTFGDNRDGSHPAVIKIVEDSEFVILQ